MPALERKTVSSIVLPLLLIGLLVSSLGVPMTKASETVYIRAGGEVDPPTAPISRSGDTYTLTGNLYESVVIERDSVVIDGAGYTVQDAGSWVGIQLEGRSNVTIKNTTIRGFRYGIHLVNSSGNSLLGNEITANEKDGIWVDGSSNNEISGNRVIGNSEDGVDISYSSTHNSVRQNNITQNDFDGIVIGYSSDYNNISLNNVTGNDEDGVDIYDSSNNSIFENNITDNWYHGVRLADQSSHNRIFRNNIARNDHGTDIASSSNNVIYHNNFIDNFRQVYVWEAGYANTWNEESPSGGNYWSDNAGVDTDQDALADAPYVIDADNRDQHPLMALINVFDAGTWNEAACTVEVVSNSTVTDFNFNPAEGPLIRFNAAGQNETRGFCRVTIPKNLLWTEDGWTVLVGGESITDYKLILDTNDTYIYITYDHSIKTIEIRGTHAIPEFPSFTMLLLATLGGICIWLKRTARTDEHITHSKHRRLIPLRDKTPIKRDARLSND